MNGRLLAILSLAMAATACGGARDVLELTRTGTLRDLITASDTAIVLAYDPSTCFECSGVLGHWLSESESGSLQVTLVFTREPTAAEEKLATLFRLPVVGVLKQPISNANSVEMLFIGGNLRAADTSEGGRLRSLIAAYLDSIRQHGY